MKLFEFFIDNRILITTHLQPKQKSRKQVQNEPQVCLSTSHRALRVSSLLVCSYGSLEISVKVKVAFHSSANIECCQCTNLFRLVENEIPSKSL